VWVVNATPRSLYHGVRDPVLIVQEDGWAPGQVRTGAENLAPPNPRWVRFPDPPARRKSLYRLHYPSPLKNDIYLSTNICWHISILVKTRQTAHTLGMKTYVHVTTRCSHFRFSTVSMIIKFSTVPIVTVTGTRQKHCGLRTFSEETPQRALPNTETTSGDCSFILLVATLQIWTGVSETSRWAKPWEINRM
jgi:hypothetical protein